MEQVFHTFFSPGKMWATDSTEKNWLIEFKDYLGLLETCTAVLQFFCLRTQNPNLVLFTVFDKWASPPLLLSLSCQSITLSKRKVPEKIVKYLFFGDKDQCVGQALETAVNGPG